MPQAQSSPVLSQPCSENAAAEERPKIAPNEVQINPPNESVDLSRKGDDNVEEQQHGEPDQRNKKST